MRTLVIGGRSGIGETIVGKMYKDDPLRSICVPSVHDLDVRSPSSFVDYFDLYGPFDQVVYSAGVNYLMPLGEIRTEPLRDTFDINVQGFIRLLDTIVDHSKAFDRPKVSVVGIVSDSATTAMRHSIAYASSKAALAHAVRCGARELAPWCRVNGVSPSIVEDTPMTRAVDEAVLSQRGWTEAEAREYEMSLVPMQRRATKAEVADLVLSVLAGPEFLTGAIIPITGGK